LALTLNSGVGMVQNVVLIYINRENFMDGQEPFENLKTLPTTSSSINDELTPYIEKMRMVNSNRSLKLQFAKTVKPSTL
jgi:hypothetical protein